MIAAITSSHSSFFFVQREQQVIWKVDTTGDAEAWIQESHELAKSFAYSPEIIAAVEQPGELQKINLPAEYLKGAGAHARERIVAAGVRLAALISAGNQGVPK